ncbi:MAG: ABC transporter ATP-binding protein [Acidobacteriota bacterium]|nr:ABC transporter ATP-binding protein [Acidobacteriota bacterium]MDE3223328.1 ABC transporter ATP-binding protein [Acidobacteriota bacterium]
MRDVSVHHGQLLAVNSVSFDLNRGEVLAVIGANGAGKSTLLRTIAGLHHATSGEITYEGTSILSLPAHRRVTSGISLVPEGRRLFQSMTLEENLLVGAHKAAPGSFDVAAIYDLFPWMRDRRKSKVKQFSGGEQQAVAIGRALVANPKVLMLDEVSLGLAPIVIERIYEIIPQIVSSGIGVLLVEQDVSQGLRVATRALCLLEGRTTLEGTPDQLTPESIEIAYFGSHLVSDATKEPS